MPNDFLIASPTANPGDWASPFVHDYKAFTYVGGGVADDDNVATIVMKRGGASGVIVGTLTFTYSGATNNVATVTLTTP